jgi:hypothetical protein
MNSMNSGSAERPVHVAMIDGQAVRFFRSPRRGPDLCWPVACDVMRLVGFAMAERAMVLALPDWHGMGPLHTVASTDGVVICFSPRAAQDVIQVAASRGDADWDVLLALTWAAAAAVSRVSRHMPHLDRLRWFEAAQDRRFSAGDA